MAATRRSFFGFVFGAAAAVPALPKIVEAMGSVASPVGHTATVDFAAQQGSATVIWSPVPGVRSYNIYRVMAAQSLGDDGNGSVIVDEASAMLRSPESEEMRDA